MPRKKKASDVSFFEAEDIKTLIDQLISQLNFTHIETSQVYCVRSTGSIARAYARIWGLSRIFQVAAGYKPTYVIEVLSQHFDQLTVERKVDVLIHELMHIPKTFSGALLSHKGRYHRINDEEVKKLKSMINIED